VHCRCSPAPYPGRLMFLPSHGGHVCLGLSICVPLAIYRLRLTMAELLLSRRLSVTTMRLMRPTRLIVLLVTMLTLPVYGLAGVTQRSCQEQMSAASHTIQAGDCCPGKTDPGTQCKDVKDASSPTGKGSCTACKAGYNCKSPHSYQPSSAPVLYVVSSPSTAWTVIPSPLISHSPDGMWRPPTLS
jgi:hypothetical protein